MVPSATRRQNVAFEQASMAAASWSRRSILELSIVSPFERFKGGEIACNNRTEIAGAVQKTGRNYTGRLAANSNIGKNINENSG